MRISDIGRYFEKAAPHHHRDEELHVFPPLLQAGNSDTVEAVRRLQADHVQMESLWGRAGLEFTWQDPISDVVIHAR